MKEEAEIWKKLVVAAEEVRERKIELNKIKIKEYGQLLDKSIRLFSGGRNFRDRAKWLTINDNYKMDESFYKRTVKEIKDYRNSTHSVSTEVLCYRISEIQKCSPEEVYDTLTTLELLPPKAEFRQEIINAIKDVVIGKEITDSERMKEGASNGQGNHDLQGNRVDGAKDVRLSISQYTNQDNALKTTKEDLKEFVTKFIGAMSCRINVCYPEIQGGHSELLFICVVDNFNFGKDIIKWEYVRVTYFASGSADEEIQQEMELLHKLVIHSKAFVIIACATDEIFRHVRENIAYDRKNSIMILCYEHPDEAYIYLNKNPQLDKECFEYLKPSYKKYFYYMQDC